MAQERGRQDQVRATSSPRSRPTRRRWNTRCGVDEGTHRPRSWCRKARKMWRSNSVIAVHGLARARTPRLRRRRCAGFDTKRLLLRPLSSKRRKSLPKAQAAPAPKAATQEGSAIFSASLSHAPAKPAATGGANRIFSSPLARRLAKEVGVDLARIQGSGPHGRIIARDIEDAKSGKGRAHAAAARRHRAGGAPIAPVDVGQRKSARSTKMAATNSCRMTACAAPSRSASLRRSQMHCRHFYVTVDCPISAKLLGRPRGDQHRRAGKIKRRQARLQDSRSTTSSSRPWHWRCSYVPGTPTSVGRKPAMLKHKHSDVGVAVARLAVTDHAVDRAATPRANRCRRFRMR